MQKSETVFTESREDHTDIMNQLFQDKRKKYIL